MGHALWGVRTHEHTMGTWTVAVRGVGVQDGALSCSEKWTHEEDPMCGAISTEWVVRATVIPTGDERS